LLSKYAKGVVAWLGNALAVLSVFIVDGAAQADTWVTGLVAAGIAALTALGVVKVENKDPDAPAVPPTVDPTSNVDPSLF
jgi:hypothetical protein